MMQDLNKKANVVWIWKQFHIRSYAHFIFLPTIL